MALSALQRRMMEYALGNKKQADAICDSLDALNNGNIPAIAGSNKETLTASGAANPSLLYTYLDGTTNASAITLAAPTADGQTKIFALVTSAANHPTLAGTNIFGQSAATGTFAALGDWLILESLGGKWVIVGKSITFA